MNVERGRPEPSLAPQRVRAMVTRDRNRLWAARRTVALVRSATVEAQRSKLPQMAAALAFRTIFGLIPMMVVGLVALNFFYTDKDIEGALRSAMTYSGLSSISVDQQEMGPFPEWDPRGGGTGVQPPPAAETPPVPGPDPAVGALPTTPTTGSERLDAWVADLVSRVRTVNLKAISAIGILFVIYAAIAMLVEIERAFNQIYRVPVGRSWVRRVMQYWTMLTLGAAGLTATFFVGQRFMGWLSHTAQFSGGDGEQTMAVAVLGYFTTVAISTALLLLMYMVVPNTRVKLLPGLAGAFIAALLWEAGKWGFTQYLHYSAFYARLYGSIALIPLFLLWVYLTWVIVLLGLQVSYYLQHARHSTVAQPVETIEPAVVDPAASLLLMGALAKSFETGKPSSPAQLAAAVAIQQGVVRQLLSGFAEAAMVLRVPGEDGADTFTLARPADKISAEDVLKIGDALANPPGRPVGALADRMRQARWAMVRGKSVAEVVDGGSTAVPPAELRVAAPPAREPPGLQPPNSPRVDLA
jgi:membrane protein